MPLPTTHEGWTNYATWLVVAHFDNYRPWYNAKRAMIAEHKIKPAPDGADRPLAIGLADHLRDFVKAMRPELRERSLWSDLLTSALDQVNWLEIARDWLSEVAD